MSDGDTVAAEDVLGWQDDWDQALWPNYGTPDVQLVSGQGTRVTDSDGRTYTDLLAGIAVNILGHGHPALVEAVSTQAARLAHTSNLYAHPPGIALAKRLRALAPGHKAFLCNSGTEANEAALKLIRRHAHADGREGVVLAFAQGFHGRSLGSLALTGQKKYHDGFAPLPGGVVHVPYNDPAALEQAFEEHEILGVFAEFLQGEGGVRPMARETAQTVDRLCRTHDAVLVADEIQAGMGRTGRFFAFEHYGVQPDVITLAKGLGGGMPIGAALARDGLAATMGAGAHGTTFGGNPVCAAAANTVLDVIASEDLTRRAATLGTSWEGAMDGADLDHRGMGLLQGILAPGDAAKTVRAMREDGFIVGQAGDDVVRIAPALTIGEDDLLAAVAPLAQTSRPVVQA